MQRVDLLSVLASLEPRHRYGVSPRFHPETAEIGSSTPRLQDKWRYKWMDGNIKRLPCGTAGFNSEIFSASIFPRKHFLLLPGFPSCELRWKQEATAASRPLKPQMKTEKKRPQARLLLNEISTDVIISSFLSEVDNVLILTKEQWTTLRFSE